MILCLSYEQSNVTRPMDKDHRTANGPRLVRLEDPRLISASINHPRGSSTQFSVRSSRNGDVDWIPRQTRSKHLPLPSSFSPHSSPRVSLYLPPNHFSFSSKRSFNRSIENIIVSLSPLILIYLINLQLAKIKSTTLPPSPI